MSIGYVPKVPASRKKKPNGTRMRKNEKKKPDLEKKINCSIKDLIHYT